MLSVLVYWLHMNKKYLAVSGALLLVIVGAYVVFDKQSNTENNQVTTSTTTPLGIDITTSGEGGYVIEQVPLDEGRAPSTPPPSLTRKTIFAANVSADVQKVIQEKITALIATLTTEPTSFTSWIELGTYHKIAGDFEGARIYWTYANNLGPDNFVSFANLGDLYAYYLKDLVMMEKMYTQAIANAPRQASLYISFATAYRDVYRDVEKAKKIIQQGLSVIPKDSSLLEFQKTLQ